MNRQFYNTYYNDNYPRTYLIGINPGRFGAGVTGIPFTDPIRLAEVLGIEHELDKKPELSSKFIYEVIEAAGGPDVFFGSFYFTSVSPVGFVKGGKNLNYYDLPGLQNALEPFMIKAMHEQFECIKPVTKAAFCLGMGKNYKYFSSLNERYGFFEEIIPLPHPRWIMQYRLRRKKEFVGNYIESLSPFLR